MRETIIEITGRFQLSGNNAKLRPLKKVFGPTFTIKEKIGTLEVTAYFKTLRQDKYETAFKLLQRAEYRK